MMSGAGSSRPRSLPLAAVRFSPAPHNKGPATPSEVQPARSGKKKLGKFIVAPKLDHPKKRSIDLRAPRKRIGRDICLACWEAA